MRARPLRLLLPLLLLSACGETGESGTEVAEVLEGAAAQPAPEPRGAAAGADDDGPRFSVRFGDDLTFDQERGRVLAVERLGTPMIELRYLELEPETRDVRRSVLLVLRYPTGFATGERPADVLVQFHVPGVEDAIACDTVGTMALDAATPPLRGRFEVRTENCDMAGYASHQDAPVEDFTIAGTFENLRGPRS